MSACHPLSSGRSKFSVRSKRLAFLPLALGVVVFDQLGKLHAANTIPLGSRASLIGDVLSLAHVPIEGGAFGFLAGWAPGAQLIGFALLSIVATTVVVAFYRGLAPGEYGNAVGLGAILGGIVSHTVDRLRFGASVDFIQFGSGRSEVLPAFNLADLAIVLGVVTLIVELLATEMAARASERPRR
jgi:signal peptidase II